ncbi:MAG: flagellar basal body P-ring formation protein FlgA [Deltaproteobacteria bacterium]|nr:flagellar basal body P-ring formation protein FlgA [Deltaproteobacteria bacterium]
MTARLRHRAAIATGGLLLGLAVIAPGVARGGEPGRITVKRTAVVSGPTIKLADLAALEGGAVALADVDLGPAPTASAPRRLDGEAILRRLEEAGMDASATRYVIPATVRVEREAREVSVDEIRTAVMNVARDALPAGETIRDLEVAGPVRIPAGGYEARVSTSSHGRAGRRRFDVQLVNDGAVLATVPVTARTDARGSVVVAKQPLPRGTVLGPGDLAVVERDRHDVPDDALTEVEEAIGMETKVALAADAPLPRTALAPPVVVKKGDLVTMIVETAAMKLTVAGEALEPGAVGAGIKVMNRASRQTVAGKVIEHGVVLVVR